MLSKNIKRIALKARKITEEFQKHHPEIGNKNLGGFCGIGSTILVKMLRDAGYEPDFVLGNFSHTPLEDDAEYPWDNHCWVEIQNHIIDITATQFGSYDDVQVYKLNNRDARHYTDRVRNDEANKELMDWEFGQNPFLYDLEAIV